jgi:hypothetical protein
VHRRDKFDATGVVAFLGFERRGGGGSLDYDKTIRQRGGGGADEYKKRFVVVNLYSK